MGQKEGHDTSRQRTNAGKLNTKEEEKRRKKKEKGRRGRCAMTALDRG